MSILDTSIQVGYTLAHFQNRWAYSPVHIVRPGTYDFYCGAEAHTRNSTSLIEVSHLTFCKRCLKSSGLAPALHEANKVRRERNQEELERRLREAEEREAEAQRQAAAKEAERQEQVRRELIDLFRREVHPNVGERLADIVLDRFDVKEKQQ